MKRGFRITLWILAAIVILLLALVVAVQSPTVQTALARKAITMLSDKIDGDITVGRISVYNHRPEGFNRRHYITPMSKTQVFFPFLTKRTIGMYQLLETLGFPHFFWP